MIDNGLTSQEVCDELVRISSKTYFYKDEKGLIAWRLGTGQNIELLYLKSDPPRTGGGKHLLVEMLKELKKSPPYCTIYGFTRSSNLDARKFYEAMGFSLTTVVGVYADGIAVCFSANFDKLVKEHL